MMTTLVSAAGLTLQQLVAEAGAEGAASIWPTLIPIFLVMLVFWFVVIAPQRKEQQQKEKMRGELKKGDMVVTIGGMHGEIVATDKNTVTLRISPKVEVVFEKVSISRPLSAPSATEDKKA